MIIYRHVSSEILLFSSNSCQCFTSSNLIGIFFQTCLICTSANVSHIFRIDGIEKSSMLTHEADKVYRVNRSGLADETIRIADAFDFVYIIRNDLQRILGQNLLLLMKTDFNWILGVTTDRKYTTEAVKYLRFRPLEKRRKRV